MMSNYPAGSMRGSGIYSYDEDTVLSDPCEQCGSEDGILFTDDWGTMTLSCAKCDFDFGEQEPEGPDPDHERDLMLEREWEDRYEADHYRHDED